MIPRHLDRERLPRPSRRTLALGSVGMLAGAVAMAVLGFTAGHATGSSSTRVAAPTPSASTEQLTTLSLSEVRAHKPLP